MMDEGKLDRTAVGVPALPDGLFGRLIDGLNSLGSLLIAAIMLLVGADVLSRNLFNQAIAGVSEMVAASIVAILFLQLGSALRHGRMPRADLFIEPLKAKRPAAGYGLEALFLLAGAGAVGIIVFATWPLFHRAWQDSEYFGVEGIFTFPVWPVNLVVLIGGAMTAVQYLVLFVKSARAALGGPRPLPTQGGSDGWH